MLGLRFRFLSGIILALTPQIVAKYARNMSTTRGLWFGKFTIGSKFRVGVINKQDFEVTIKVLR